jgi:hypothetical protein
MESLVAWAFAGLLSPYPGADSTNMARSLRRRFAGLGVILGLTLVGTLWVWTANIALIGGAAVLIGVGLWLYSEHGDRPAA